MTIRAPADGTIEGALTWQGALINAGKVVGTWYSNTRVVTVKISEESFGKVKLGQPARLRLLTFGSQNFAAVVSKLHPSADDAQRFTVFLDVKVVAGQLFPNSTGEATITVDQRPDQIMIRRRALVDNDKVYIVAGGRIQLRRVEVGYIALNVVEVRKGLEVGEWLVVDRLDEFRDGQRVRSEVIP
jgi:multidrug efflux system membrane fusion protein